jgi:hypothetical protein
MLGLIVVNAVLNYAVTDVNTVIEQIRIILKYMMGLDANPE